MITFGGQRMWTKGHKRRDEARHGGGADGRGADDGDLDDDPIEATARLRATMQALYDQTIERYEPKPEPGAWWWPKRFGGGAATLDEMRSLEAEERAKREGRS